MAELQVPVTNGPVTPFVLDEAYQAMVAAQATVESTRESIRDAEIRIEHEVDDARRNAEIAMLTNVHKRTRQLFEEMQSYDQTLAYEFAATRNKIESVLAALLLERELLHNG